MIGTAWIVTGWTIVGGTVFLFGFFLFYDITPPTPPTTTPVMTTTGNAITGSTTNRANSTLLSTIMSSPQPPSTVTTIQPQMQCGVRGEGISSRIAEPFLGPLLTQLLEGRIIGGTTAVFGEWPWMAYLFTLQNGPVDGGFCGGTLVSDQWVVSAAHCIGTNNPSLYGVILGAHTISTPSGFEVTRNVGRIITHPLYDSVTFNYDIVLLQLSEPVAFTQYILPSCIVPSGTRTDQDRSPTFAGALCSTLGWGFTSSPGGQRSDILMQLNLVITPESLCRVATIQNAADYENRPVLENDPKFCAGGQLNEDSCDGDSGGPLVCLHEDGIYYLHGITSYGTRVCAQAGKPGVYTEVAQDGILSFINNTIAL